MCSVPTVYWFAYCDPVFLIANITSGTAGTLQVHCYYTVDTMRVHCIWQCTLQIHWNYTACTLHFGLGTLAEEQMKMTGEHDFLRRSFSVNKVRKIMWEKFQTHEKITFEGHKVKKLIWDYGITGGKIGIMGLHPVWNWDYRNHVWNWDYRIL